MEDSSSKTAKWGPFILILLLTAVVFGLLALGTRAKMEVSGNQNPYRTFEGTLDYYTGNFLFQMDLLPSDLEKIMGTAPDAEDFDLENGDSEWTENYNRMKDRVRYMEGLEVAEPFAVYKQEVNGYFKGIISTMDEMVEAGTWEEERLWTQYLEMGDFMNQKVEELPPILEELGVEYTVETGENGEQTIRYYRTDSMPIPR